MHFEISFAGVIAHLTLLRKELSQARSLKRSLEALYLIEKSNPSEKIILIHRALDRVERLECSIYRKIAFLDDLTQEFKFLKYRAQDNLDEIEHIIERLNDR